MNAVEFQNVSKSYAIYDKPGDRLKELLTFGRRSFHRDFWALRDLSFEVRRGETFCIVGENGSGKSTLLQMVAGILLPSAGDLSVNGRVSALLELGAGFNPEFSGRENVYLNGSILGLTTKQIDARYRAIEEFAEIGDFIRQPVKTYSSGMVVRLAFAIAIHVDPEILLVDEALAVGDLYFRHRCMRKVHELRARGVTILFVSHALADVKAVGDRALWIEHGKLIEIGATDMVVAKYLAAMTQKDSHYLGDQLPAMQPSREAVRAIEIADRLPNIDHRHGDRRGEILGIAILNTDGRVLPMIEPLSTIVVRISVKAHEYLGIPNVGFMMRNAMGVDFAGTNALREDTSLPPMYPGDIYTVDFHLELPELYATSFSFSPALADGTLDDYRTCDWVDNAIAVQMGHSDGPVYGYMRFPCRVEVNARLDAAAENSVA
ncbi:MAG TPA: ABC transporter ATP-binding protein [Solibacterales bacterium]|nr:ABC transporter ATP-binding protein [Bryobacterales bacterium]